MKTQETNQLLKVYAHYTREIHPWREKQTDEEITKDVFEIFQTESGALVAVEKDSNPLETEFWIGEGHAAGRTFDEAQSLCHHINNTKAEYFIYENTKGYEDTIKKLDAYIDFLEGKENNIFSSSLFYLWMPYKKSDKNPLRTISNNIPYLERETAEKITLADAKVFRDILVRQKEAKTKRCNTYLKRFGTRKIHAKSYWADR